MLSLPLLMLHLLPNKHGWKEEIREENARKNVDGVGLFVWARKQECCKVFNAKGAAAKTYSEFIYELPKKGSIFYPFPDRKIKSFISLLLPILHFASKEALSGRMAKTLPNDSERKEGDLKHQFHPQEFSLPFPLQLIKIRNYSSPTCCCCH